MGDRIRPLFGNSAVIIRVSLVSRLSPVCIHSFTGEGRAANSFASPAVISFNFSFPTTANMESRDYTSVYVYTCPIMVHFWARSKLEEDVGLCIRRETVVTHVTPPSPQASGEGRREGAERENEIKVWREEEGAPFLLPPPLSNSSPGTLSLLLLLLLFSRRPSPKEKEKRGGGNFL